MIVNRVELSSSSSLSTSFEERCERKEVLYMELDVRVSCPCGQSAVQLHGF
jgi:hypothetical protein